MSEQTLRPHAEARVGLNCNHILLLQTATLVPDSKNHELPGTLDEVVFYPTCLAFERFGDNATWN